MSMVWTDTSQIQVAFFVLDAIYIKHSKRARCAVSDLVLGFLGGFSGEKLLTLEEPHLSLKTHDTSAPLLKHIAVVVELSSGRFGEGLECVAIFGVDGGQANNGGVLLVDERSEASTALNNDVRDVHPLAEGREENYEFDRVDVMSDDDKLGLLLLNKVGHMLEAVLKNRGRSARVGGSSSFSATSSFDALLLCSGGFRRVLAEELEELNSLVLAEGVLELVEDRRDLKTLLQDLQKQPSSDELVISNSIIQIIGVK